MEGVGVGGGVFVSVTVMSGETEMENVALGDSEKDSENDVVFCDNSCEIVSVSVSE